jgi:hypothetical protein
MIMAKKIASALLILLIIGTPFTGSAQWGSSPNLTPIWGTPITMDPIWGPSEQKLGGSFVEPIWGPSTGGRNANRETSNNRQRPYSNDNDNANYSRQQQSPIWNNRPTMVSQSTEMSRQENDRDTLGRLTLIDSMILRDGDSSLHSGGSASGSTNSDDDDIAPPPDDPVDAPIDGGLSLLVAIALVHGYKQLQKKVNSQQSTVH